MSAPFPKAVALLGPTASGKTSLALALAEYLPIEIISLDSALVYQDMDIGTAKPSKTELATVPHHLINIISPLMSYSAAQFVEDCTKLVTDIHQRGHLPLIVGGTMMYYHALTQGLNNLPEADVNIRANLNQLKQQHGLAYLYAQLQQIDPTTAARLPPADSQRIERALEVFYITGQTLSSHFASQETFQAPIELHSIALIPNDRQRLHHHIQQRFQIMLQQGFLEEVAHLCQKYPALQADLPSMRSVGYRQALDRLNGKLSQDEFIEHSLIATRQLAKRQLTWLRKLNPHHAIDPYTHANLRPWLQQQLIEFFR